MQHTMSNLTFDIMITIHIVHLISRFYRATARFQSSVKTFSADGLKCFSQRVEVLLVRRHFIVKHVNLMFHINECNNINESRNKNEEFFNFQTCCYKGKVCVPYFSISRILFFRSVAQRTNGMIVWYVSILVFSVTKGVRRTI